MEDKWKKEIRRQRIAQHVSTIRRSKGISIAELAEKTGYEPASIRKIENGTLLPEKDRDREIAQALGISFDQLWGRKRFRDFYDNGQPKLTESDRTALTLLSPMLKAMSREGRAYLIETALMILKAEGSVPKWEEYIPDKSE